MAIYGSVRQGDLEPPVFFGEWVQVRLPLEDGTNPEWRNLYNELAADAKSPVPAAVRGTEEHGILLVTLPRNSTREVVKDALERSVALVFETNDKLGKRQDKEYEIRGAVHEWWQHKRHQI